jgi:hypothetical protein|tara:strand:+ start:14249 stop:14686 length:438 start_codon:yes stop_codon:yes gene_type:complete
MVRNIEDWKIKRIEIEKTFVQAMHQIELRLMEANTVIEVWEASVKMQQETLDKLFTIIPGMDNMDFDMSGSTKPLFSAYKAWIGRLEENKTNTENAASTLLTVGDAFYTDNASIEELEAANAEFKQVLFMFTDIINWRYGKNDNE